MKQQNTFWQRLTDPDFAAKEAAHHAKLLEALKRIPIQQSPANPNNCQTCDHIQNGCGGYCYMFKYQPTEICAKHT